MLGSSWHCNHRNYLFFYVLLLDVVREERNIVYWMTWGLLAWMEQVVCSWRQVWRAAHIHATSHGTYEFHSLLKKKTEWKIWQLQLERCFRAFPGIHYLFMKIETTHITAKWCNYVVHSIHIDLFCRWLLCIRRMLVKWSSSNLREQKTIQLCVYRKSSYGEEK